MSAPTFTARVDALLASMTAWRQARRLRALGAVRVPAELPPEPFGLTRRGAVTIEGRRNDTHAARCVAAWWSNQESSGRTAVEVTP